MFELSSIFSATEYIFKLYKLSSVNLTWFHQVYENMLYLQKHPVLIVLKMFSFIILLCFIFFSVQHHTPSLWKRFVDDTFVVKQHLEEKHEQLQTALTSCKYPSWALNRIKKKINVHAPSKSNKDKNRNGPDRSKSTSEGTS